MTYECRGILPGLLCLVRAQVLDFAGFVTHAVPDAAAGPRFYTLPPEEAAGNTMNLRSPKIWSNAALSLAGLLLIAIAGTIIASRYDLVSYPAAFAWLRNFAIAGAVLGVAAVAIWIATLRTRSGGVLRAAITVAIMAVTVGVFYGYQAAPPPGPFMNDITTDLDDPPQFIAVLPLRPAGSNPAEYGGPEVADNQRQTHPEVQPLFTTLAPDAALERALEVAEELGWNVIDSNRQDGRIEAVDTTPFFRFKDDVVVRVREDQNGSRIDLRSHSRIGLTDLGKNAARIMQFIQAFPVQG